MKIISADATKGEQIYAALLVVGAILCSCGFVFVERDVSMLIFGWLLITNFAILENKIMIRGIKAASTEVE